MAGPQNLAPPVTKAASATRCPCITLRRVICNISRDTEGSGILTAVQQTQRRLLVAAEDKAAVELVTNDIRLMADGWCFVYEASPA